MEAATTSYVERNNGTVRHKIGRMRRLTYAFSKRRDHLACSIALNYAHYNFCTIVKTLRVTPVMQLGITDHVWGWTSSWPPCWTRRRSRSRCLSPSPTRSRRCRRELPNGRGWLRLVK